MQDCPSELPVELSDAFTAAARVWFASPLRPRVLTSTADHWDELITRWIGDQELPLFLRKSSTSYARGQLVHHRDGRGLVFVDNSPAQWIFAVAAAGETPSWEELRAAVVGDRIPVAFATRAADRDRVHHKAVLGRFPSTSAKGWKLAHVDPVGFNNRAPAEALPIRLLEDHFRKLMSPRNMYVVPTAWAGVAETPEWTAVAKEWLSKTP